MNKVFVLREIKKFAASLGIMTVMVALSLIGAGQLVLLPAFVLGYFVAAVYFLTIYLRLKRSMNLTQAGAKREMIVGMLLRLVLVFAVLAAAIKISLTVFLTVIAGFGAFYVLILAHLIIADFRLNILEDSVDAEQTSDGLRGV